MPSYFTRQLLTWHQENPRPLPWTGGPRDPYHIWISEVIMQQTRIEQGANYYHRFIAAFPSVDSLASASIDAVLLMWEGLGYYTRARNLHKAANYIVDQYGGLFPRSYEDLLALPGVGPYSAAAIASFAYGLPYPVVDGNVKRLVSRFAGIRTPVDTHHTHELIRRQAARDIRGVSPAVFNQAIMNFGALVCKPKNPLCSSCLLRPKCFAYQSGLVDILPAKSKVKTSRERHFHFLVLHFRDKIVVEQRSQKDIWNGLFVLPYLETSSERKPAAKTMRDKVLLVVGHEQFDFHHSSSAYSQILSHQIIIGRFHHFIMNEKPMRAGRNHLWSTHSNLINLAKPKIIVEAMKNDFNNPASR